ncbi:amino acid transporter [Bradyrhizobium sp. LB7.2]
MTTNKDVQRLPLRTLTAMVVGGMVGAGVFSIPRNFAQATGIYGALIAWAIAGAGMLMLCFVFQTLANRKPDLDAGVYAYARAGFGPYVGFFSAFGYWASACVGNVSYWILIKSTLGAFFPAFGPGQYLDRSPDLLGRDMGIPFSGAARREGSSRNQRHRHGRQDHSAAVVRGVVDLLPQAVRVRGQPLGRRGGRLW